MILILMLAYPVLGDNCTLLGEEAKKPSPSLVKCYRHNISSCCVSAHDQEISNRYEEMFSVQCQRQYNNMEDYLCFACNPNQPDAISGDDTLYVCKGFAERLWGGDLNQPTDDYDNCGMFDYWGDGTTILPSKYFNNAYEFFERVKPPFFENRNIVVVDRDDDCFNLGQVALITLSLVIVFF